jgi:hypothetical protein
MLGRRSIDCRKGTAARRSPVTHHAVNRIATCYEIIDFIDELSFLCSKLLIKIKNYALSLVSLLYNYIHLKEQYRNSVRIKSLTNNKITINEKYDIINRFDRFF